MLISANRFALTRTVILLAVPTALAGCASDQLPSLPGFGGDTAASAAAPPPAPTRVPPPFDVAGRWVLTSLGGGSCNMTFGNTGGATEGTIAPEGGCPGNFFTTRKWTSEPSGLVLRDHTGQVLARLAAAGSSRFEGESTSGQPVALTR
jgi:Protease inhibitor Inh